MNDYLKIPFHTFLLKIASRCNINCKYCYIYSLEDQRWKDQPALMDSRTITQSLFRIKEHLINNNKKDVSIILHGGEPMLGGLKHISEIVSCIEHCFRDANIDVSIGMQSNLLLFNDELGEYFLKKRITVGVSIDGPPAINDVNRVDHKGNPTSNELEVKLNILTKKYKKIFSGFLSVINPTTDPTSIIRYLLSYDPPGIDFLFPLDNHDRYPPHKNNFQNTIYGDWLINAYEYWNSTPNNTEVRIFNSLINLICKGQSKVESFGLGPVDLIVIESNGEIEGVDSLKSVYDGATKLGFNIFEHKFDQVTEHISVKSRQMGAVSLSEVCKICQYVKVCGGGYLPHRYSQENGFRNPSIYCYDLQKLISHIHQDINSKLQLI
jgi:uncharacterized protein